MNGWVIKKGREYFKGLDCDYENYTFTEDIRDALIFYSLNDAELSLNKVEFVGFKPQKIKIKEVRDEQ